jgi:hypothetical protein
MDSLPDLLIPILPVILFLGLRFFLARRKAASQNPPPRPYDEAPEDPPEPSLRETLSPPPPHPAQPSATSPHSAPAAPPHSARSAAPAARSAPPSPDLAARLAPLPPLARAVVLAEILGPPKGLR